ncbi:MAG: acylphosphatase [Candidatus Diapherotrites archaeon]
MNKKLHAFVSGRVQGVFFRAHAKRQAEALGISGWVRNLQDGRVEVLAEGAEEKLREFEKWLRSGPDSAEVERLEAKWETAKGGFSGFEVRH